MHNNSPLVSVFIPYYNDEKFLKEAIESVLNQTYENFELILLNHATTDTCREIAHSYNDERIVHIDMEKNYGAGGGILFEQFLKVSKGKYLKTFCADDIMKKDCLSELVNFMEDNPEKDFAFCDVTYVDENAKSLNDSWFKSRDGFVFGRSEIDELKAFSRGVSHLPYIGAIIKKDALNDYNPDKVIIMLFDMSIWVYLLSNGKKIGYINKQLLNYRIHREQVSSVYNMMLAGKRSFFEFVSYINLFEKISDVDVINFVFDLDENMKLKKGEEKYIPFVVDLFYLNNNFGSSPVYCFNQISKILEDDILSKEIKERFNYDIENLRKSYSLVNLDVNAFSQFQNPKHIGARKLAFLFFRQIWNILKRRKNRKGECSGGYSL